MMVTSMRGFMCILHNNEKEVSIVTLTESYSVKSRNGNQFWRVDLVVECAYQIVITAWNTLTMQMNTPKNIAIGLLWYVLHIYRYIYIYTYSNIYVPYVHNPESARKILRTRL